MAPQIRYARTTDGVGIAYTSVGKGPPVLFCNFELGLDAILAANLLLDDAFASSAKVTYFDQAGGGASDRDVTDLSAEAYVRAIESVVATCMQDEPFTLIAMWTACPGAALYAIAHPERVERMICIMPSPPWVIPAAVYTDWSMGRRMTASLAFPDGPVERQRWYSQACRDSISQAAFIAKTEAYQQIVQLNVFERVRVPTLFVGRRRERGFVSTPRASPRVSMTHAWC
jgi:pimeloyl-ACP methyl ester carboxylesterase